MKIERTPRSKPVETNPVRKWAVVKSSDGSTDYTVTKIEHSVYRCTCLGFAFHPQNPCKHIEEFKKAERRRRSK